MDRWRLVTMTRQVRQKTLDRIERLFVGVYRKVDQPGHAGQ